MNPTSVQREQQKKPASLLFPSSLARLAASLFGRTPETGIGAMPMEYAIGFPLSGRYFSLCPRLDKKQTPPEIIILPPVGLIEGKTGIRRELTDNTSNLPADAERIFFFGSTTTTTRDDLFLLTDRPFSSSIVATRALIN